MVRIKRLFAILLVVILGLGGFYIYRNGWRLPTSFGSLFSSADSATANRVNAAIDSSKRLAGFPVDATASNGVVTLTGQLPSDNLKSLAGEITRDTTGVTEVNNQITVDATAKPSSENAHIEDLEIRAAILESFTKSSELGGKNIEVKVENRTVTLSGSVDTQAQKNGAEQTASAVDGVAAVANNLSVNNPQTVSEPAPTAPKTDTPIDLAKQLEFELYRTGAFDTRTMKIAAADNKITLSGAVRSLAEKLLAEKIVQSTPSVKQVVNELTVVESTAKSGVTAPTKK